MIRAGAATPGEIGIAFTLAFILGLPARPIVDAIADGEQNPMLGDAVNVNLDVHFLVGALTALTERFAGQAWLDQLVQRFVLTRNVDAALALDRGGLSHYHHWTLLSSAAWVSDDVRAKALVRAVVHGELDVGTATHRAHALDDDARVTFDAQIREEVAA